MRNIVVKLSALLLLVAANASAEDNGDKAADKTKSKLESAKEDTQDAANKAGIQGSQPAAGAKYGPAGCGLGSLVFKPDSGFTQIFAATTNGTSATQTFGISSGTSNCDTGPGNSKSAKTFIEGNRTALAKDSARGRGEAITSLAVLAGCSDTRAVGLKLQHSFRAIFSSAKTTDEQVSDSLLSVLASDSSLSCSNLG